ncbi:AzlD domain-containing protein [Pseudonocardia spinosispora]|uniref:AzlD domain-containing protein n=1 Tax=Pseudonocardia spinosispora TaxID=103441 RepID=UPI00041CEB04|nr:AzlD domain-containing protein [Pseudonocardia spinosispora]
MTGWAVAALGAGTYGIRLSGLLLRRRLTIPDRGKRLLDLAATALLTALVATAALTEAAAFAGWARPAGVLLGALAAWRRLPLVLVVLIAAGATAAFRACGIH